jgi:hypothetical protein
MNLSAQSKFRNASAPSPAEETLRLIANLPAPLGLEDRVLTCLHVAPRHARVFAWPVMLQENRGWLRVAAAAALALAVVGGGWEISAYVRQSQQAKVIVAPPHVLSGGFSNAGAMRTPQSLNGSVLVPAAPSATTQPQAVPAPPAKNPPVAHRVAAPPAAPASH